MTHCSMCVFHQTCIHAGSNPPKCIYYTKNYLAEIKTKKVNNGQRSKKDIFSTPQTEDL